MKKGKIIILSAPSGTGKSTIIKELMKNSDLNLGFSISATSRLPREREKNGREYYFITEDEFKRKVALDEFVEWEEVYAGTCYGTLISEVERVTGSGKNLIMDIDVKGGMNVKKRYGHNALSIFILPPDIETLGIRLRARATDPEEKIRQRLAKAEYEISFADNYDCKVVNDSLPTAVNDVKSLIKDFVNSK
ncbi:MAG: guanylate kinase [Prevotella sp.]|nr:guanylate kinase [Bacteroides sp.]MCM1366175.1 guanylate kinase [Prevotella sp.]MCM1436760.1 guanylate kinase [Prevotella sp.]